VFGCAHPPAPPGTHVIAVSHDTIKIRCNASADSWTLRCEEPPSQQWTGTTGNCTASEFIVSSSLQRRTVLNSSLSNFFCLIILTFICEFITAIITVMDNYRKRLACIICMHLTVLQFVCMFLFWNTRLHLRRRRYYSERDVVLRSSLSPASH